MNNRVLQLAEQAGYRPLAPLSLTNNLNEIFMRKYAQLIIQECIDIITPYAINMVDPGTHLHPIIEIKRNFGIK